MHLLLMPEKWPADIAVSAWKFKPKEAAAEGEKVKQKDGEQTESTDVGMSSPRQGDAADNTVLDEETKSSN